MELEGIFVYPVKGARAIALDEAQVTWRGLAHDRRFMFVSESGKALTQRQVPALALVETALEADALVLSVKGARARVPLRPEGPRRSVVVWGDTCEAIDCGDIAADLGAHVFEKPARLVYMPDDVIRHVEPEYARPTDHVGFADAYPLLVTTRASLEALNARLETPLPMDRFRPNLVLDGGAPFEEDLHAGLRVGAIRLRTPKRCARCVVTTIDQETAEAGKEPLRTLATFRAEGSEVHFGQNAIPDAEGLLRVGDDAAFLGASG